MWLDSPFIVRADGESSTFVSISLLGVDCICVKDESDGVVTPPSSLPPLELGLGPAIWSSCRTSDKSERCGGDAIPIMGVDGADGC